MPAIIYRIKFLQKSFYFLKLLLIDEANFLSNFGVSFKD